ncbi:unnamed protein product [Spirodela intermedia]|uniref:Endoglucanase n=1 Tax=Spirodela intermedia TaxID=51605 RepID=A0A7I8J8Y5_SPIIN|nr:unnamed protein product [Spirodela intermedia]CAA6666686.1 unnamed protein product [Spirodela intermedia]
MGLSKYTKGWCSWLIVLCIAALVIVGAIFAIKKKSHNSGSEPEPAPVPGSPGAVTKKYADALSVAIQFFDVQKSGKLVNNKIPWRGDSALNDGKDANVDLSKGLFDAGDHMKFGLPMAFTATVLAWSILEYGDQIAAVKQLESAQDSLKWITDYLVNAHPKENVLFVQVGDPKIDHKCWERPESMSEERPVTQVNETSPGSDIVAETAAALASASMVFRSVDSTYSDLLLRHARELFKFADKFRGSYSESIPSVQTFYNSTGYLDELLWAASWLYHATGEQSYLSYVTETNGRVYADWGKPTWFSWDDKRAGTQVLLSRVTIFSPKLASTAETVDLQNYRKTAEAVVCGLLPDSPSATASRTDGGLIWVEKWNSLDYMLTSRTPSVHCGGETFTPADLRKFAASQVDYILGDNPMKMSYLVGYGSRFPQQVHHRGASIPVDAKTGCKGWQWLSSPDPNPNNDSFIDLRNNPMQTEPSTYNSAVFVGLLSGLVTTSSVPLTFTSSVSQPHLSLFVGLALTVLPATWTIPIC